MTGPNRNTGRILVPDEFPESWPQMTGSCVECARLWREYADAKTWHVRLESKFQTAFLSYDDEAIAAVTPMVERAAAIREARRAALRKHEVAAHQNAAAPKVG